MSKTERVLARWKLYASLMVIGSGLSCARSPVARIGASGMPEIGDAPVTVLLDGGDQPGDISLCFVDEMIVSSRGGLNPIGQAGLAECLTAAARRKPGASAVEISVWGVLPEYERVLTLEHIARCVVKIRLAARAAKLGRSIIIRIHSSVLRGEYGRRGFPD